MRKLRVSIAMALVTAGAMTLPAPQANAWTTSISLYRCVRQARPTLCFGAATHLSSHEETCEVNEFGTYGDALYGGGVLFAPIPYSEIETSAWSDCNYHVPGNPSSGYTGFVKPCAPGGPEGWHFVNTYWVDWESGSEWGYYDVDYSQDDIDYPLQESTCPGSPWDPNPQ